MAVGDRIKRVRNFRCMTQKELGLALGYAENTADVRIAQYESSTRTPKEDTLRKISEILDVSPYALADPCLENRHGVMQALFSMEDNFGLRPVEIDGQIMLCIDRQKKNPASTSPEDDLRDWCRVVVELAEGAISREEYDEWRYSYPRGKGGEREGSEG